MIEHQLTANTKREHRHKPQIKRCRRMEFYQEDGYDDFKSIGHKPQHIMANFTWLHLVPNTVRNEPDSMDRKSKDIFLRRGGLLVVCMIIGFNVQYKTNGLIDGYSFFSRKSHFLIRTGHRGMKNLDYRIGIAQDNRFHINEMFASWELKRLEFNLRK